MADCLVVDPDLRLETRKFYSRTLIRPQLKPVRVLVKELRDVLFLLDLSGFIENEPQTEVKLALEEMRERSIETSVKQRAMDCSLAEMGDCPGRGFSYSSDLERDFVRVQDSYFRPWFKSTQTLSQMVGQNFPYQASMRAYINALANWHNCLEESVKEVLVCKDVTCRRRRVPCVLTRCLD